MLTDYGGYVIVTLLDLLSDRMHVPAVFGFVSTRMVLSFLTTLLINIFLGPWFIAKLYQLKIGQPIRIEDCPTLAKLHQKKQMTPTMGGLLILFSLTVSCLLWMDWSVGFTWVLMTTLVWMGGIGIYDDWLKLKHRHPKGLAGKMKMILQIAFALGICAYLFASYDVLTYFLPFKKSALFDLSGSGWIWAVLITMFVIVGCSNSVNLTDGLDGLAAGTILPVALVLGLFAFLAGNVEVSRYLNILYVDRAGEIAVFLTAIAGACLGFLWYNGNPAQVFMGDTGSLALGGMLGVAAVLLRREGLLALIGGIFVVEALSVILQVGSYTLRNKKRIFLCTPLHHHFEYKGWPENKVVIRFWIIGFLLAAIGLASLKFQ